jgi:dephospho-CoA kinase
LGERPGRKPVIGVIGGIGAGKSTVAAALARRGGAVIDADQLGHRALETPGVRDWLLGRWGPRVLKPDGSPDRRAVGRIVFADPAERRSLEEQVFPVIRRLAEERIAAAQTDPAARFVVLDAAVLLEAGWTDVCDKLVYIDAPREVRLARLAARSRWSADEVAAREAAQLPAAEKRRRADAVIVNDGPAEKVDAQIDTLLAGWGVPPAAR